jgi:hypothetical protein
MLIYAYTHIHIAGVVEQSQEEIIQTRAVKILQVREV